MPVLNDLAMSQSRVSLFLNAFIFHPKPITTHITFPANTKVKVKVNVTLAMLIACLVITLLSLTYIRCFTNAGFPLF